MTPALEVAGLRRTIAGRDVVDGVDLALQPGELLVLVGPSGCGKSTLLRAIAGLEPASGIVRVGGRDVGALPPERRHIGLVFQDHALFPHLRVAENLSFGARGMSRADRELVSEPVRAVARRLQLEMVDLRWKSRQSLKALRWSTATVSRCCARSTWPVQRR